MGTRDRTLDRLRAFAMLWVIVVHVIYWGLFFESGEVYRALSFGLFEMPLFFFITGASNSFGRETGWLAFVGKRWRRLLVPYWVFAVLCAALSVGVYAAEGGMTWLRAAKILLSWLIPVDRQITSIPYLKWIVWFVPVYLCVVPAIPLLRRMKDSGHPGLVGLGLAGLFLGTFLLDLGWVQNVAFYLFWTYAGLFYREIRVVKRKHWVLSAAAGALAMGALALMGFSLDMQDNKFPPTLMFFAFSCTVMALLLLVLPQLDGLLVRLEGSRPGKALMELYARRSTTIFLYQVFAFQVTVPLAGLLPGTGMVFAAARAALCLGLTVPACAGLAVIFGGIENWGIGVKSNKFSPK